MSNKTQLQTNNTQLASLIQTLQGKAAGGGGSSGGGTDLNGKTWRWRCPLCAQYNARIGNVTDDCCDACGGSF